MVNLMLFRVVLGLILIILSFTISRELSKKYRNKRVFFSDLYSFNQQIITEVSFSNNTLPSILKTIDGKSDFNNFIKDFFANGTVDNSLPLYLNEKERKFIVFYLSNIGKSDSNSQKRYFEDSKNQIVDYLNESKENESKYTPLYLKMGVLIGFLLFIIVI